MVRPPFSVRQDPGRLDAFHALHEGVPEGLRPSLVAWTLDRYCSFSSMFTDEGSVGHLERTINREVVPGRDRTKRSDLGKSLAADDELLLDAADVALTWASESDAAPLET